MPLRRGAAQLVALGYAVPGAVIVVGMLLPVGWVQARWPESGVGGWITVTIVGLVWAYLVRFVAVALQSMQSGYARVPRSLDESARMLGAGGLSVAARVHWPLLRRSTAAAAFTTRGAPSVAGSSRRQGCPEASSTSATKR